MIKTRSCSSIYCEGKLVYSVNVKGLSIAAALSCRFTLEELEAFLEDAKKCIPGAEEAIAQALEHKAHQVLTPPVSHLPLAVILVTLYL